MDPLSTGELSTGIFHIQVINCPLSHTLSAPPPLLEAANLGPRQAGGLAGLLSRYADTGGMALGLARPGPVKTRRTLRPSACGVTLSDRLSNRWP